MLSRVVQQFLYHCCPQCIFCQVRSEKSKYCEILLPSSGQKERHSHRGFNLTALTSVSVNKRVHRISRRDHWPHYIAGSWLFNCLLIVYCLIEWCLRPIFVLVPFRLCVLLTNICQNIVNQVTNRKEMNRLQQKV